MKLHTKRLIIRDMEENDMDDISEYGTDEETGKYMLHWPKTKAEIRVFMDERKKGTGAGQPKWMEYVIELKEEHKVIGNVSIMNNKSEAEIGWISNRAYWNKGYMTEAVKAIINKILRENEIRKIYATCAENNIGTCRVMEKAGMKLVQRDENIESMKDGHKVKYTRLKYEIGR